MPNTGEMKSLMSSDFTWDLERPERTHELFERYDVQKAKQIIFADPRLVEFVDLKTHGLAIQDYLDSVKLKSDVDWDKIDVSFPAIFVRTASGRFPIDGRHRLAKALNDGTELVPVVYLTETETDSIRTAVM